MPIIAPSLLAADWSNLESEIKSVTEGGADWLHLDVMDGRFVPPITFGARFVESVKKCSSLTLDVHLMIERPELHIDSFVDAGADLISFHLEATPHAHRLIQMIQAKGVKAGIAINPGTPVSALEPIIGDLDLALIMSVNPGWGGQKFLQSSLTKITELSALIDNKNAKAVIEVDGGVDSNNALEITSAGAEVLVAGTSVFSAQNREEAIKKLKDSATLKAA